MVVLWKCTYFFIHVFFKKNSFIIWKFIESSNKEIPWSKNLANLWTNWFLGVYWLEKKGKQNYKNQKERHWEGIEWVMQLCVFCHVHCAKLYNDKMNFQFHWYSEHSNCKHCTLKEHVEISFCCWLFYIFKQEYCMYYSLFKAY